jgi:hypothetical protein
VGLGKLNHGADYRHRLTPVVRQFPIQTLTGSNQKSFKERASNRNVFLRVMRYFGERFFQSQVDGTTQTGAEPHRIQTKPVPELRLLVSFNHLVQL